ncbi:hypothetical protein [Streptomyces sp. WG-D5]
MTRWVITLEYGAGDGHSFGALTRFDSSRDEARAALYRYACEHRHRPGLRQRGREVFREHDDAYYVRVTGAMSTHDVRYRLAELVWSTDDGPDPGPPRPPSQWRRDVWAPPPGDTAAEPSDATPDYWRPPDE